MRHVIVLRLTLLLALALTVGCLSENKGKIEGTRWSSLAGTVKARGRSVRVPNGFMELHFHADGSLYYTIRGKIFTGKYSLGMGSSITLYLDEPIANSTVHTETVVIKGDRLTMTDSDGTELNFRRDN